jgi:hypothetical protein
MRPQALATASLCLVLALVGCASVWQTQQLRESAGEQPEAPLAADPDELPEVDPLELIHTWDARRASAYAEADVAALRGLYADGSIAGRRDVAVLRSYRARGLRVVGLTTQLLDVRSVLQLRGEVVLRVTDRLAAAFAVGPGRRIRLPAGTARTRVVTLVDEGRGWVVAEVRPWAGG